MITIIVLSSSPSLTAIFPPVITVFSGTPVARSAPSFYSDDHLSAYRDCIRRDGDSAFSAPLQYTRVTGRGAVVREPSRNSVPPRSLPKPSTNVLLLIIHSLRGACAHSSSSSSSSMSTTLTGGPSGFRALLNGYYTRVCRIRKSAALTSCSPYDVVIIHIFATTIRTRV
uniref:Uncharacterized protein n=1 Tax=Sipha flava TaxID=143950 RepID=A0A2S2QIN4_9HEMI